MPRCLPFLNVSLARKVDMISTLLAFKDLYVVSKVDKDRQITAENWRLRVGVRRMRNVTWACPIFISM